MLPGAGGTLPLTGRMDLVLFPKPIVFAPGKLGGAAAWVIDFKSGGDEKLSLKKLAKGEGLQVALYARGRWVGAWREGRSIARLTLLNVDADAFPQNHRREFG